MKDGIVCSYVLRQFAHLQMDRTPCVVGVMKHNGWLIHAEDSHICCTPQGEFFSFFLCVWDAQPLSAALRCGKLQLGHSLETAILKHSFLRHCIISGPFSQTTSHGSKGEAFCVVNASCSHGLRLIQIIVFLPWCFLAPVDSTCDLN